MPLNGSGHAQREWALAIHGGSGTIGRDSSDELKQEYMEALRQALAAGREVLENGGTSLDAVELVVRTMEDDPHFNAGRGAVYARDGSNLLDAAIMDGQTRASGAVAAVRGVRNPISLSRRIMTDGEHVFMAGEGAELYAREAGLPFEEEEYFHTEERYRRWRRMKDRQSVRDAAGNIEHGTVGAVALDRHGNLAAATSTGGLTNKRPGRVGDTPVIGAGTFADNRTCAISCTGDGEEFIKETVAFRVSAMMEYGGRTLKEAAVDVVHRRLTDDSGGLIAVDVNGNIQLQFNSDGMNRGAADSSGLFEVAIW